MNARHDRLCVIAEQLEQLLGAEAVRAIRELARRVESMPDGEVRRFAEQVASACDRAARDVMSAPAPEVTRAARLYREAARLARQQPN